MYLECAHPAFLTTLVVLVYFLLIYCICRPYLNCFEHDDDFLIEALKSENIKPPSNQNYNFTSTEDPRDLLFGQYGQPIYLESVIFKGKIVLRPLTEHCHWSIFFYYCHLEVFDKTSKWWFKFKGVSYKKKLLMIKKKFPL